jgi:hypothetical protein
LVSYTQLVFPVHPPFIPCDVLRVHCGPWEREETISLCQLSSWKGEKAHNQMLEMPEGKKQESAGCWENQHTPPLSPFPQVLCNCKSEQAWVFAKPFVFIGKIPAKKGKLNTVAPFQVWHFRCQIIIVFFKNPLW